LLSRCPRIAAKLARDIVLAIGLSTMIPYLARCARQARWRAHRRGSALPTDVSDVDGFTFKGAPAKVLALVWEVFAEPKSDPFARE
jgi:hypothetical protein